MGLFANDAVQRPCWVRSNAEAAFHTSKLTIRIRDAAVAIARRSNHQSHGRTSPMRIASARASSGTPSSGPIARDGHNTAMAASSVQTRVVQPLRLAICPVTTTADAHGGCCRRLD
jgi:hypothetical protein